MAVIWPNKIRPGSDPFLPSSFKKYDNDNEFEVPKITGQRRFSMASSTETRDQRTIIGEHIFIEGDIRGEENLLLEGSIKGNIDMGM